MIDVKWYGAEFKGMKLAGILTIALGFVIVLLPTNLSKTLRAITRYFRKTLKCFHLKQLNARGLHIPEHRISSPNIFTLTSSKSFVKGWDKDFRIFRLSVDI